jgi:hypothetical protein
MQTGQSWTKMNHVPRCVKGLLTQGDGHQIIFQNQAVGCATLYENLLETLAMEIPTILAAAHPLQTIVLRRSAAATRV